MELHFDKERTVNAALYMMQRCGPMEPIKLMNMLWYADLEHYRDYGRPITGAQWVAVEAGAFSQQVADCISDSGAVQIAGAH
jgi:hypothetical protein